LSEGRGRRWRKIIVVFKFRFFNTRQFDKAGDVVGAAYYQDTAVFFCGGGDAFRHEGFPEPGFGVIAAFGGAHEGGHKKHGAYKGGACFGLGGKLPGAFPEFGPASAARLPHRPEGIGVGLVFAVFVVTVTGLPGFGPAIYRAVIDQPGGVGQVDKLRRDAPARGGLNRRVFGGIFQEGIAGPVFFPVLAHQPILVIVAVIHAEGRNRGGIGDQGE
jgi:hypothetical protein